MPNTDVQRPHILRLPRDVVEKIAAGEVIERPANLVKELMENCVDAGATQIEIEFSEGGRSIRIVDNGCGIAKDELKLSIERHTTSKIRRAEDLWSLNSFGFRGEALASIAAVAELSVSSRVADQEKAWKLECHFGQSQDLIETSQALGTEIRVQRLFENVPARLKFLKSESAEHAQIKRVIKSFALMWPQISFKIRQKNELVAFWPASDLQKRIEQVLGLNLSTVTHAYKGLNVQLCYSSPMDVEKTSQNIWIFVQKRWVQDRTIQAAVLESYRNLLMHGEYPTVVVDVRGPPDEVDVNIHPAKSQVKFLNNSVVYSAVYGGLRNALETTVPKKAEVIEPVQPEVEMPLINNTAWDQVHFYQKAAATPAPTSSISTTPQGVWSQLQILGQSNLTYILAQSRKNLILIDQHAAHERIVFERLMKGFKNSNLEVQNFLLPIVLKFEPDYAEALMSLQNSLERIGISVDSMGPETAAVRSAPAILKESAVEKVLCKLAKEKLDLGASFALENTMGDIFATMACHSVIRAGQSLSHEEMKSLLSQMDEFPFSSFCPHGRPVYIEYAFTEIEREFGRIL